MGPVAFKEQQDKIKGYYEYTTQERERKELRFSERFLSVLPQRK